MSAPRTRRTAGIVAAAAIAATSLLVAVPNASAAPGVVAGTVYRDVNDNGLRDSGEPGVPGVVMTAGAASTVTDANGRWSLGLSGVVDLRAMTGWYRSQCDASSCEAGPGDDQEFSVENQQIVANDVDATAGATLELGLIPDWNGGYPIPGGNPPANAVDVSARLSWVEPTGAAGASNCFRTTDDENRACHVGDTPQFLVQIFNEGTQPIANAAGYLQLSTGLDLTALRAATAPANHPAITGVSVGAMSSSTRRVPFTLQGTLPPAGVAVFVATFTLNSSAPLSSGQLPTSRPWPIEIGLRVTSPSNDVEGDVCSSGSVSCAFGGYDKQQSPDNSDRTGHVAIASATPPTSTAAPTTTVAPTTTTIPATTTTVRATTTTVRATTTTVRQTTTTAASTTTVRPTTTTAPSGQCSVNSILVPSCGAWFGASTTAKSGGLNGSDYVIGLAEYEAVAKNTPDILHFYKNNAQQFPTATEIGMAERAGKQRAILHYNWKPGGSWGSIARGAADSNIATVANAVKKYKHKIFIAIHHEPEETVGSGSGYSAADFVAMFRHVVTRMRSLGVTNVVWVMNYMGYKKWSSLFDSLYPGNDVVDWIAYDPYGFDEHTDFGKFLDDTKTGWPGFYTWATRKAPGKPIMLAEWGFDLREATQAPAVLDGAAPIIQSKFPMLKALVYWNDYVESSGFSVRIDQNTTLGRAYGAAYSRMANHPYFNSTPTNLAP